MISLWADLHFDSWDCIGVILFQSASCGFTRFLSSNETVVQLISHDIKQQHKSMLTLYSEESGG